MCLSRPDSSPELLFLFGVLLLLHTPACLLVAAFRCAASLEEDVAAPAAGCCWYREGATRGRRPCPRR